MTSGTNLVGLVTADLCGFLRGKFVSELRIDEALEQGVSWVPANAALTSFGLIPTPNPFGSIGDLRLQPDVSTRVVVDFPGDGSPLDLVLCDQVEPDGSAWDCCPRTFARAALEHLHERTGLRLCASFEYEFQLDRGSAPPFSVEALRQADPFGAVVHDALAQAGCRPEFVIPEYGSAQFEVPCGPAVGVEAADRATILRAVVREAARVCGRRATFTPMLVPDAVGNGGHLHFSLVDDGGRPATGDRTGLGGLSAMAAQFVAGVLSHARALCAVLAPLPISYLRLRPGHWSSGAPLVRVRDREAFLSIRPHGDDGAHLELRAADAAASPYLVLGVLALSGLAGIDEQLPPPPLEATTGAVQEALPESLAEALDALEQDSVARAFFPPRLLETYTLVKRSELDVMAGLDDAACCERYASVY